MADIFSRRDASMLLRGKKIYLFGCSNMRAFYKDLICLIERGTLINNTTMRRKLDPSCMRDKLVKKSTLTAGRHFVEEREYNLQNIYVKYCFITKCWCDTLDHFLNQCNKKIIHPDVIIINSCLWDITRWGPNGVDIYKRNLVKLFQKFRQCLPKQCIVIWTSTLPVSTKSRPAFLVEQIEFLKHSLQFDIMEANILAKNVATTNGYDVLDLYHYFKTQFLLRNPDGVHWKPVAVRFVTNLVLTHLALSWNHKLPRRVSNLALQHCINMNNVMINPPSSDINLELSKDKEEKKVKERLSRNERIRRKPYDRNQRKLYENNEKRNWQRKTTTKELDDYKFDNNTNSTTTCKTTFKKYYLRSGYCIKNIVREIVLKNQAEDDKRRSKNMHKFTKHYQ